MLPLRSTRQQQDGHVGASDQQQRRHCAEQEVELCLHRLGVQIDDAPKIDTEVVRIAVRRFFGEALKDGLQFGIRLLDGHSGTKLQQSAVIYVRLERELQ